jgi:hypothetical protein
MNDSMPADFAPGMLRDLQAFQSLGQETLALVIREHQALDASETYESAEFYEARKSLLERLNQLTLCLKHWRSHWQKISLAERLHYPEIKLTVQMVQDLIVKILQLDRENQQALLRRGLVPVRHIAACAAPPSNHVLNLYRKHN